MALEIVNRSVWPTAAIRIIARWVCRREKLGTRSQPYKILVRSTKRNTWGGRGGRREQRIVIHRRYSPPHGWPYDHTDPRFKHATTHRLNSRVELLVYLLAHEAHHATGGRPSEYARSCPSGSRVDKASMEFDCNLAAYRAVRAFRMDWSRLRPQILAAVRKDRSKKTGHIKRLSSEFTKLRAAEQTVKRWERKLKLAQTKVKKYRKKVGHYRSKAACVSGSAYGQNIAGVEGPRSDDDHA